MSQVFDRMFSSRLGKTISGVTAGSFLATTVFIPQAMAQEKAKNPDFKGKIAKKYEDSKEWWAPEVRPPKGAPNVIIFLLDDVGFAQIGSFGGLIDTPNIDKLAEEGLRFNNFHTTALSSPSRASLMAGRNPHSIGLGSHALTAMGFPGYLLAKVAALKPSAYTGPEKLRV